MTRPCHRIYRAAADDARSAQRQRGPRRVGPCRRFRAFDADTGKILWEAILCRVIQMSTISYAVDGRQYVAVMTGDGQSATANPIQVARTKTVRGHNEIYVFALPVKR
jgi:alcohol dehydrogenase (cytochrome c)